MHCVDGIRRGADREVAPRRICAGSESWELCAVGRVPWEECGFRHLSCRSPISHAIPLNDLVNLFQFASSCHSCFGIACDFVGCDYGWGVVDLAAVSMLVAIGGVCATRSPLAACRRRVGPRLGSPPPISHAIPLNDLVYLFQFVLLCHLYFGIACDIVEPACAHGGLCGGLHLGSRVLDRKLCSG